MLIRTNSFPINVQPYGLCWFPPAEPSKIIHRLRIHKKGTAIKKRYLFCLIYQCRKGKAHQLPPVLLRDIDLGHHKMVGGGLAVQQESVIAVGQHDRGAAAPEHLRLFAVEGDIGGLEGAAGVELDLLIQLAGNPDVDKVAVRRPPASPPRRRVPSRPRRPSTPLKSFLPL